VQQPGACLVAIKQADQQAILSLHRICSPTSGPIA
jgi:hypothetical protein